jgi:hypothetical protein
LEKVREDQGWTIPSAGADTLKEDEGEYSLHRHIKGIQTDPRKTNNKS